MRSWPLFALRIRTPKLELRLPQDPELDDLAQRSQGQWTEPSSLWMNPWVRLESPQYEQDLLQRHWQGRAQWSPQRWRLGLGIFTGSPKSQRIVGIANLSGQDFLRSGSVHSGSWLLPEARGAGMGTDARRGLLQLAFAHLGALEARSSAHPHNQPSLRVSQRLGYREDGSERMLLGDGRYHQVVRLMIEANDWQPYPDVSVEGWDECVALFGL